MSDMRGRKKIQVKTGVMVVEEINRLQKLLVSKTSRLRYYEKHALAAGTKKWERLQPHERGKFVAGAIRSLLKDGVL